MARGTEAATAGAAALRPPCSFRNPSSSPLHPRKPVPKNLLQRQETLGNFEIGAGGPSGAMSGLLDKSRETLSGGRPGLVAGPWHQGTGDGGQESPTRNTNGRAPLPPPRPWSSCLGGTCSVAGATALVSSRNSCSLESPAHIPIGLKV